MKYIIRAVLAFIIIMLAFNIAWAIFELPFEGSAFNFDKWGVFAWIAYIAYNLLGLLFATRVACAAGTKN